MEPKDKKVLSDSLSFLKGHLIMSEVKDHLKDVLPLGVVNAIYAKKVDESKCSYMVEMLCKRDAQAMNKFLNILEVTAHGFVADYLREQRDPEVVGAEEETDRDAQTAWSRAQRKARPATSTTAYFSGRQYSSDEPPRSASAKGRAPQREDDEYDSTEDGDGDGGEASGGANYASRDDIEDVIRWTQANFVHRSELEKQIKLLQEQVDEKDRMIKQLIVQHENENAGNERKIKKLEEEKNNLKSELKTLRNQQESQRRKSESVGTPRTAKSGRDTDLSTLKAENARKDLRIAQLEKTCLKLRIQDKPHAGHK